MPEFGEPVSVQVVSESSVAANITIQYSILDREVRLTELHVGSRATAGPIGPDLAAIVRIDGSYVGMDRSTPAGLYILGEQFNGGDVITYVIPDPSDGCPGV